MSPVSGGPSPGNRKSATPGGVDTLYDAAYQDLRRLAHARLRDSGRDALLNTTMLVHESYVRLSRNNELAFPDRARFLVYAGQAMRSIIVDLVRQRQSERRGGGAVHVTLSTQAPDSGAAGEDDVLRVHEALNRLSQVDERMANVVEMRYFAGLTEAEMAEALGVTDRTIRRDWEQARLFLAEALK
jgi:RNA polymerase sigma factor (TIGR02999 family)